MNFAKVVEFWQKILPIRNLKILRIQPSFTSIDIDFHLTYDTLSFHLDQAHPKMIHLRQTKAGKRNKMKDIERERP